MLLLGFDILQAAQLKRNPHEADLMELDLGAKKPSPPAPAPKPAGSPGVIPWQRGSMGTIQKCRGGEGLIFQWAKLV